MTTPDAEPTRESIWGSHNEEEKIQHKTEPDTSTVDTRLPLLMSVELDDDTDVDAAAESLDLIDERLI